MCCDVLAGTAFHKENDVYSRMATDKIVVGGKHFFNSTPPLALTARLEAGESPQTGTVSTMVVKPSYPVLIKSPISATLLPGEGFPVQIRVRGEGTPVIAVESRKEAPVNFTKNHLQEVVNG